MSGSETGGGMVVSGAGLQQQSPVAVVQSQPPPPAALRNMHLSLTSDGIAVYKPPTDNHSYNNNNNSSATASPTYQASAGGDGTAAGGPVLPAAHGINVNMGIGSAVEPLKRKRGRPRKYGPDGAVTATLAAHSLSFGGQSTGGGVGGGEGGGPLSPSSGGSVSPISIKKARGRPPGSSKKQQLQALGSAGVGFAPHVITVKSGEDVCSKIMSFSQHGPRAVCILTANGAISNVTLRQPATSGGTVTYEGRFEILSLSGSFMLYENGDQRTRTGGLSVSLSGPDGRVLGGSVAGLLIAASPVQVVLGSFIADGNKESKSANQMGHLSPAVRLPAFGGPMGAGSPPSRGILSESSGGPETPPNQNTGVCLNSHPQDTAGMPWN